MAGWMGLNGDSASGMFRFAGVFLYSELSGGGVSEEVESLEESPPSGWRRGTMSGGGETVFSSSSVSIISWDSSFSVFLAISHSF